MLSINQESSVYYEWILGAKDPIGLLLSACVSSKSGSAAFYEPTSDHSWMDLVRGYPEHNWEPAILASEWGGVTSEQGHVVSRGDRQWAVIPVRRNNLLLGVFICDDTQATLQSALNIQRMFQAVYAWAEAMQPEDRWKFAEKSTERWLVCDKKGIYWWNEAMYSWLNGPPQETEARWPSWLCPDSQIRRVEFWLSLAKNESWSGPVTGEDTNKPMWWQISSLDNGKFLVRVNTYDELSSNAFAKSHWQTHDPVTGLPRQSVMSQGWRADGSNEWGFAVWSVDNFHILNQTQGMVVGDKVLEIAANTINRALPQGWHLWRGRAETFYGMGPSFPGNSDWYSQTLTIDTPITGLPDIRCSIGLTSGSDYRTCMLAAQEALEFAQESNGHQAVWNSSERRLRTPNAVAAAVAVMDPSVSCNIVYLPIMTTSEPQKIQAFEALLRWHHPYWGIMTPDMFWREAERTDTIHRIGPWMIETLLKQIKAWQSMGHQAIEVHANVSAAQIQNPAFTDFLTAATKDFDWNGAKLMLEIPEREVHLALDAWRRYQPQWEKLGIGIVLDDWGTGPTANAWLSELSINRVKLSSSLVHSIKDPRQRYSLKGLVSWLHHCGYSVIADGIESSEQKQWASDIGCDAYQGYLNTRDRKVVRWKK